jgi:tRNA pseudouridine55 synthase
VEAGARRRVGDLAGVLVVDKPAGPTSFEVVDRVRRAVRARRAGHAGTLDPLATGVLAVCLGDGVKLQRFLAEGDKAYEALVAFGVATDTEDAEGRVVARGDPTPLDAAAVAARLGEFTGEIDQVPPMFSAVRVGGRRLHEAARRGEEVARPARRVVVRELTLLGFEPAREGVARARLAVRCGKGTYVRALASGLGRAVGVPAHLAGLRRTAAGPFSLAQALPLAEVERLAREDLEALAGRVVSPAEALAFLPAVPVDEAQARDLRHGRALRLETPPGLSRALDPDGRLVAVCEAREGEVRPVRVWAPSPHPEPSR